MLKRLKKAFGYGSVLIRSHGENTVHAVYFGLVAVQSGKAYAYAAAVLFFCALLHFKRHNHEQH